MGGGAGAVSTQPVCCGCIFTFQVRPHGKQDTPDFFPSSVLLSGQMFSTGMSFLQQGTVLNRRKESVIVVSVESMPLVINGNTLPIYSITAL